MKRFKISRNQNRGRNPCHASYPHHKRRLPLETQKTRKVQSQQRNLLPIRRKVRQHKRRNRRRTHLLSPPRRSPRNPLHRSLHRKILSRLAFPDQERSRRRPLLVLLPTAKLLHLRRERSLVSCKQDRKQLQQSRASNMYLFACNLLLETLVALSSRKHGLVHTVSHVHSCVQKTVNYLSTREQQQHYRMMKCRENAIAMSLCPLSHGVCTQQ